MIHVGSANRRVGPKIIAEIQRLARNVFFDEQLCPEIDPEVIDFRAASEFLTKRGNKPCRRQKGARKTHLAHDPANSLIYSGRLSNNQARVNSWRYTSTGKRWMMPLSLIVGP